MIFTWNDPQLFHNFSSVFWDYILLKSLTFPPSLQSCIIWEGYKTGHDIGMLMDFWWEIILAILEELSHS